MVNLFNYILKNKYIITAAVVCVIGLFVVFSFNGNTTEGNTMNISESENINQTHLVSDRERAQQEPLEVVVEAEATADNNEDDNTGENK